MSTAPASTTKNSAAGSPISNNGSPSRRWRIVPIFCSAAISASSSLGNATFGRAAVSSIAIRRSFLPKMPAVGVGGRAQRLEKLLVLEAPAPLFARLERARDRVPGAMKVPGGVLVRRLVAAAHVTTLQADAQVHPARADPQTVLAAQGAGLHIAYVPRGQVPIVIPLALRCFQDRV